LFTRDFLLLCASSFLFSSSMFLLFAVLPLFVVQELKGAQSQVGLIMGAFAVSSVLSRPGSGRMVDLWSRKAGLSLGALIYCVAPALYTQVGSVPMMLGLRFFHGIGIAVYTTSGSVLAADLCPPTRRGEGMGYYGMSMNLAMTVGPALGAALVEVIGFTGLFWLSSSLALASLLLVQFVGEPHRAHGPAQGGVQRPSLFSRAALFPGFIAMCMTMTFGTVVSFLPLFVRDHGLGNPGLFFTVYSIVVVASRPFAGQWSDRFGRMAVIIPGMALLAVAMIFLAYATTQWGLLGSAVLQGLGFGCVHPAIMAWVVDRSTIHDRGPALATLMGAFDLGMGLSAIGLGIVLQHTSFTVLYLCAGGIALFGAGACAAVTFVRRGQ
jgi:MFS family permease